LEITIRITISPRNLGFWACSKNQCTLGNGEENKEFDEVTFTQAIARVAVGVVLKLKLATGHCKWV